MSRRCRARLLQPDPASTHQHVGQVRHGSALHVVPVLVVDLVGLAKLPPPAAEHACRTNTQDMPALSPLAPVVWLARLVLQTQMQARQGSWLTGRCWRLLAQKTQAGDARAVECMPSCAPTALARGECTHPRCSPRWQSTTRCTGGVMAAEGQGLRVRSGLEGGQRAGGRRQGRWGGRHAASRAPEHRQRDKLHYSSETLDPGALCVVTALQ